MKNYEELNADKNFESIVFSKNCMSILKETAGN
jgi:hypothetical protein